MKKDLISIEDLSVKEIEGLFSLAKKFKRNRKLFHNLLEGKSVCLVFQKPSNRTRVSFEVAVFELGGNTVYLGPQDIRLGEREAIKDVARTLSRYVNCIVARTFAHEHLMDLAKYATVCVINGLTDLLHPSQALADIFTIKEKKGTLEGISLAFVGDGNNVLHSLLFGCSKLGINLKIATPKNYQPNREILEKAQKLAKQSGAKIELKEDPRDVVKDCDFLYTDVWVSMGQERERQRRLKDFQGYQLNPGLLKKARKKPLLMHCLPAHRGEEITDEVLDSKQAIVFDQAENRLHLQKAILVKLLGNGGGCRQ